MEKIIEVKDLTFEYEPGLKTINNVSFEINKGDYVAILGHNGSGKSTIAKLLIGLLEKKSGSIIVNGYELNLGNLYKVRDNIGILDEATSMLDPMGRREINSLVKELNKTKDITIISITHDIEEAKNADKVIMLNNGKIVISGRPEDIFSDEMNLVKYELDIPFALKVAQELEKLNIKTSKSLDMEVLIEELCQLHLKK